MKNPLKVMVIFCLGWLAFVGTVTVSEAADFGIALPSSPLFYNQNLTPGQSIDKTITVFNFGSEAKRLYLDTKNDSTDGLAEVLDLKIYDGEVTYFEAGLVDLFRAPISLGEVNPGSHRALTFSLTMSAEADNSYQAKTANFDYCIGFVEGEVICREVLNDAPDLEENDDSPAETTIANQGGGASASVPLKIKFSQVVVDYETRAAAVSWESNQSATSYLVCGNISEGPFDLNADDEYFGYEFVVAEDVTLTKMHVLTVPIDTPGDYECRPASREKIGEGFTVGDPIRFTFPPVLAPTPERLTFAESETTRQDVFPPLATVDGVVQGEATSTRSGDESFSSATQTLTDSTQVEEVHSDDSTSWFWWLGGVIVLALWMVGLGVYRRR